MSEKTKKFAEELSELISIGNDLLVALQYEFAPKQIETVYLNAFEGNKEAVQLYLKHLPIFRDRYQSWYSKSQAVVKQVLPDRFSDFVSYFEVPKVRKKLTNENYMIRDYLQGIKVTGGWDGETIVDGSAAIPHFRQQLNIVKSSKDVLDSTLMDLKAVLQADLFDTEIDTAAALAKAGYLRAAGAICGVVIEKHLLHVCEVHGLVVRKRNPSISDMSQLLRDGDVTTVPQWRFIQHLADIRNLCDHAKGREPTKEEIADLVEGTRKVIKTVF